MLYYKSTPLVLFVLMLLLLFPGCADRAELEEARRKRAPGYNSEANEALEKAERAMVEAGVEINFSAEDGLESLTDLLRTALADPLEVRQLEKQQKLEEAIEAFYVSLDALGATNVSAAPARILLANPDEASGVDLVLINLHLSYCYILSAVSRLARYGTGPDEVPGTEDDLFYIEFLDNPDEETLEIYKFKLTDRGQELMDAVDPDADPDGYIKVFYDEGQVGVLQAIINSLQLLLGAEVIVVGNAAKGIGKHEPTLENEIYRGDALYHLGQSLQLAKQHLPELEDALAELDGTIADYFSKGILEDVIKWGFKIRKVPPRYEYLLE